MDFSVLTKKSSHFCWQESIENQREPCSSARFMDGSGPLLLISPSDAAQIRTRKIEEKKNRKHDFDARLRILLASQPALRFTHARLGKVRAAVKLPRASWKTSPVRFFFFSFLQESRSPFTNKVLRDWPSGGALAHENAADYRKNRKQLSAIGHAVSICQGPKRAQIKYNL